MALGSIFGRFWAQVGGQVGVKLAPKSEEMGYQDDFGWLLDRFLVDFRTKLGSKLGSSWH